MRLAQFIKARGEHILQLKCVARVGDADSQHGVSTALAEASESHVVLARHRDDHASGGFAEERRRKVDAVALEHLAEPDSRSNPEAQGALDECLSEAPVSEVVCTRDDVLLVA